MKIRNIELSDIDAVKEFTDRWIGAGYFSRAELREALLMGVKDDINASFLALNDQDQIVGIRITYLPGEWVQAKDLQYYINPQEWKAPPYLELDILKVYLCKVIIKNKGWVASCLSEV